MDEIRRHLPAGGLQYPQQRSQVASRRQCRWQMTPTQKRATSPASISTGQTRCDEDASTAPPAAAVTVTVAG